MKNLLITSAFLFAAIVANAQTTPPKPQIKVTKTGDTWIETKISSREEYAKSVNLTMCGKYVTADGETENVYCDKDGNAFRLTVSAKTGRYGRKKLQ